MAEIKAQNPTRISNLTFLATPLNQLTKGFVILFGGVTIGYTIYAKGNVINKYLIDSY
jgi:hypothetical protein